MMLRTVHCLQQANADYEYVMDLRIPFEWDDFILKNILLEASLDLTSIHSDRKRKGCEDFT